MAAGPGRRAVRQGLAAEPGRPGPGRPGPGRPAQGPRQRGVLQAPGPRLAGVGPPVARLRPAAGPGPRLARQPGAEEPAQVVPAPGVRRAAAGRPAAARLGRPGAGRLGEPPVADLPVRPVAAAAAESPATRSRRASADRWVERWGAGREAPAEVRPAVEPARPAVPEGGHRPAGRLGQPAAEPVVPEGGHRPAGRAGQPRARHSRAGHSRAVVPEGGHRPAGRAGQPVEVRPGEAVPRARRGAAGAVASRATRDRPASAGHRVPGWVADPREVQRAPQVARGAVVALPGGGAAAGWAGAAGAGAAGAGAAEAGAAGGSAGAAGGVGGVPVFSSAIVTPP